MKKTLVIVAGPTASGKTRLAIDLALHFNSVIVSADSRQFFKELSIGTAKPSEKELQTVQHYFINSHSVSDSFNAGDYGIEATKLLHKIFLSNNIVIMAGGSGLYIDAVINGIDDLPPANPETRKNLEKLLNDSGIISLQELLREKDPASFNKIDINNPRRLIRALEVTLSGGKPYSELIGHRTPVTEWEIIIAGIELPREVLYSRINQRVSLMIESGLKKEAENVYEFRNHNALRTVGYKEMFDHLDGKITLEETIELISKNTRNYAKRQMTWFRKYKDMVWIIPGETEKLISIIEKR